jgi:ribosomal protein L11 methylase PrmA
MKREFVTRALSEIRPARVLDVGANTGVYSRIAAEAGAEVIAWDTDAQAADLNWKTARERSLAILPIVADFARPTPAVGWNNAECASLLSRARGQFDCVLMLGILHHLLVVDQIPLAAIIDQIADITKRWAILEWVPQDDSQFSSLCRGRESLYDHLTETTFADALSALFKVHRREQLPNGRTLWLIEKAA